MAVPIDPQTKNILDPAHDVYRYTPRSLQPIFTPKTVAVIGATEKAGSVGRTVIWNLISSPFGGTVFPVNPKRANILGIKAYPGIRDLPDPVDLAVIVTPAPTVPDIIAECVEAGVQGAIVISAGFKEVGPEGAVLEAQILERARRGRMRIIGPNCLGVMNPITGLNATFATATANPGSVAFISQSGALCTSVLDWSFKEHVGFSAFVSIGSMLDVDWGDLIYHLGDDPSTQSIVIYMETIGDARSFMSAAREVALAKPIIVIKPGRTEGAARAAASHTGSLTGSDEVLEAAFRRCGVLRVNTIGEIFSMAEVLSKQPRPKGPHLTILTNAGGPGVLAVDALLTSGGKLAEISAEAMQKFNEFLPPQWSHNNPVDILGDASPERYAQALQVAAAGREKRRPAGGAHSPGHDRSHRHRQGPQRLCQELRQAHPGILVGRAGHRRRRVGPQPGRHPDLHVSRYGRRSLRVYVEIYRQLEGALRNGQPAPGLRCQAWTMRRPLPSSTRRASPGVSC